MIGRGSNPSDWRYLATAVGVSIGAGMGLIAGLLIAGGPGIAIGLVVGAGLGTTFGAVVIANRGQHGRTRGPTRPSPSRP
jgi:hypothetical protein